jgi:hypothetical protein
VLITAQQRQLTLFEHLGRKEDAMYFYECHAKEESQLEGKTNYRP